MGFKGTPYSKSAYYRRLRKAQELGCSIDEVPDMRGKNPRPKGSRHYRWNSGRIINKEGYIKVRVGQSHPLADPNGYAYEHLVVWCSAGRTRPRKNQILHHHNEDRQDNRIENLEIMERGKHNAEHLARDNRRCPETGRLLPKAAGRLLDGQQWDQYPEVNR